MSRDRSRGQGSTTVIEHPGPAELQALVDATELDAVSRYRRLRDYSMLVTTEIRHDAAMSRLDSALQLI
jgi:hypothetical protein